MHWNNKPVPVHRKILPTIVNIKCQFLMSAHEEADFRLMVHAKHCIDSNSPVIIRSRSGDTDIFIMALTFYSANLVLDKR